jgi:LPXTG-motif cell wall-anchored protein
VLDGSTGLEVANLEDAAGSAKLPAGGVQTGFGGTAAHGPGSPLPWLAVIGAGSLLVLAAGLALRRRSARHAA